MSTSKKLVTKAQPAKEVEAPVVATTVNRSLANAIDIDAIARELAAFVKDQKLSTTVQGKEYVNVEAWQYAGSRLGIVALVDHCINVSNDRELKYQAKVNLLDVRSGNIVGCGIALCSNKENGKKFYQEFAIMSMAQTRAIGKAFRVSIAWMIKAAGYEATPAEEMDFGGNDAPEVKAPAQPVIAEAPAMKAVPAESSTPAVTYATAEQKEEIIRLLNHPVITKQEKGKMLINLPRLDKDRATQAIAKLNKAIDDRENGETNAQ